eukprot:gene16782-19137_t
MKYFLVVWNDSYPKDFFDFHVSNDVREVAIIVFVKSSCRFVFPAYCKEVLRSADSEEGVFANVVFWCNQKLSSLSGGIFLFDAGNSQERWKDLKKLLVEFHSQSGMFYRNPSTLNISFKTSLKSALMEQFKDSFCNKCNILFDGSYSIRNHQSNSCWACKKPECNGENHREVCLSLCKEVGCPRSFYCCQKSEIENHLKEHPKCGFCLKQFKDPYSKGQHDREHLCNHCKKMKCADSDSDIHSEVWFMNRCNSVQCSFRFRECCFTSDMIEKHLETHPKCSCGCGSYVLNESKLHPSDFSCEDCDLTFSNSEEWLNHDDHILTCPYHPHGLKIYDDYARCPSKLCSHSYYVAKVKKMRAHIEEFAFACVECDDVYFLRKSLLEAHKKNFHTKTVSAISVPVNWSEREQSLTTMVHEKCAIQNFPAWTLCHEEQETLTKARNELKAKLSAAKTFQLREQGSMTKNTAIP